MPSRISLPCYPWMLKGDYPNAIKEPGLVLISKSIAEALFGHEDPVNKVIKLDTKYNFKVTGVYEDMPSNSEFYNVKFFLPWSDYGVAEPWVKKSEQQWDNHSFQYFVQLANKADLNKVSLKIRDVESAHAESKTDHPEHFLHPMSR